MARPDFHDPSWEHPDGETWGSRFSSVDRASSVGDLQDGIARRYMEVQDLLSRFPPHAGRAPAQVAAWRQEVNGYGRTIVASESSSLLCRLDDLHSQVTAQLQAGRQAARAARKARRGALPPRRAIPARTSGDEQAVHRSSHPNADHFEGLRHGAATSRQRSDDVPPALQTAALRWAAVQAAMALACDSCLPDTGKPVMARQFRAAIDASCKAGGMEQRQPARDNTMVRIVVAGNTQFWTTGLPNLERLGIARFSIYRRDGNSRRFDYVAGIRRPEDLAAQRAASERGA